MTTTRKSKRPSNKMGGLKATLIFGSAAVTVVGANMLAGADWAEATAELQPPNPAAIVMPELDLQSIPMARTRVDAQAMAERLQRGHDALAYELDTIPTAYQPDIPVLTDISALLAQSQAAAGQVPAAPVAQQPASGSGAAPVVNIELAPLPSVTVPNLPTRTTTAAANVSVELAPIPQVVVPDPIVMTKSSK